LKGRLGVDITEFGSVNGFALGGEETGCILLSVAVSAAALLIFLGKKLDSLIDIVKAR
jgi:hypothetical protein